MVLPPALVIDSCHTGFLYQFHIMLVFYYKAVAPAMVSSHEYAIS